MHFITRVICVRAQKISASTSMFFSIRVIASVKYETRGMQSLNSIRCRWPKEKAGNVLAAQKKSEYFNASFIYMFAN